MKAGIGLAAAVLTTCFAAVGSTSAGEQDFVLKNRTGVEIHEVYVSPRGSDDWEEDILGRDTLDDGDDVEITFDDRESDKKWDVKVVDGEGDSIEWENLDLTKISEATLHFKNGKAWADVR